MNNLIISGVHYIGIFSLAFFAWTGGVFAAPVVAPIGVSTITETSVTLTGHAYNGAGKTVTIWYEIGEAGAPLMARETRVVHSDSVEQFYPTNLKAGTTYHVRLGAMEGADIVYSSVTAFTTKGTPPVVAGSVTNTQAIAPATVSATTQTTGTTQQVSVASVKPQTKTIATTAKKPATSTQNNTKANSQSAALVGAGDMFPQTLIGWIVLIILVLLAVLIAHMIIESNDRRKTRRTPHKEEVEG